VDPWRKGWLRRVGEGFVRYAVVAKKAWLSKIASKQMIFRFARAGTFLVGVSRRNSK
jgi:hypothetical protein